MSTPKYKFNHLEIAIVAFIANFEKKLQRIISELPVFIIETGDETYIFKDKFENQKERYLKVPRVTFTFEDLTFDTDQDSNQYVTCQFVMNEKVYSGLFRRKAVTFPITVNFVSSNFIKSLEYTEILATILSIDNVFEYLFLGNNYAGSYALTSLSSEKNPMEMGGTKNFVTKVGIDLKLQMFLPRYETIKYIGDSLGSGGLGGYTDGKGAIEGLKSVFQILSKTEGDDSMTYETNLESPLEPEE